MRGEVALCTTPNHEGQVIFPQGVPKCSIIQVLNDTRISFLLYHTKIIIKKMRKYIKEYKNKDRLGKLNSQYPNITENNNTKVLNDKKVSVHYQGQLVLITTMMFFHYS